MDCRDTYIIPLQIAWHKYLMLILTYDTNSAKEPTSIRRFCCHPAHDMGISLIQLHSFKVKGASSFDC